MYVRRPFLNKSEMAFEGKKCVKRSSYTALLYIL